MFDSPNYKRLGIWLTPDYWKTSANNPIWAILGVKCRNEWEMETGQIFVDKKLHLDVFLLIQYMLERHEWVSRLFVWVYFDWGLDWFAVLWLAHPDWLCGPTPHSMMLQLYGDRSLTWLG